MMRQGEQPPPGAAAPLDEVDLAILDDLREMYTAADPMPAGLIDRVQFAIALEDLDVEVFRLAEQPALAATRGTEEEEEVCTVTFDSESLTIMVSVTSAEDGTVRLDGWLAPAAPHTIELRTSGTALIAVADDAGRFAISSVPHGLAQLVVEPAADRPASPRAARPVVTPSILL
jgi:hypothetical protein